MDRRASVSMAVAAALTIGACGGSELESAVKNGVREAQDVGASTKSIEVKNPDTGESTILEYVHEGGHWIYHGCELLERSGTSPNCTEPSNTPEEVTP